MNLCDNGQGHLSWCLSWWSIRHVISLKHICLEWKKKSKFSSGVVSKFVPYINQSKIKLILVLTQFAVIFAARRRFSRDAIGLWEDHVRTRSVRNAVHTLFDDDQFWWRNDQAAVERILVIPVQRNNPWRTGDVMAAK